LLKNIGLRRVLAVDDNRDAADTMVSLLHLLGHQARAVYGAQTAPEAAWEFQPQMVLLDLNMPDGDGFRYCSGCARQATGRCSWQR
jgi:hypothetical protein